MSSSIFEAVNTTTGTIAWPHQALEPIYEWGNTFTAVAGWGNNSNVRISSGAPTRLVGNQDWYMYTASFNGTSGVGTGTLATRPTSRNHFDAATLA